jgi:hypothetical protein
MNADTIFTHAHFAGWVSFSRGLDRMPFRRMAEEMRDLYANEIARAVHDGRTASSDTVASWAKYDLAAQAESPEDTLFEKPSGPGR